MADALVWVAIAVCLSQSAMFSGLNLAIFSISRLSLETAEAGGDRNAAKVMKLRRDANFTLTTILWGNVAINVLLTLLAESVLAGIAAFAFSTIVITIAGEIMPQAYFSRHALRIAALLSPVLRFYQVLIAPVAWPSARLLDAWIGPEGISWFREHELRDMLHRHADAPETDIGRVEAVGASNFLALDDIPVRDEGERLDPLSIIRLPIQNGLPVLPAMTGNAEDPFIQRLLSSGRKWIVVVDEHDEPKIVLNVPALLRRALTGGRANGTDRALHRPLVVRDPATPLGHVLGRFTVRPERADDDVIDEDVVLVWGPGERRIITGSDLLGRLLRQIAQRR
jgi:metal transporter CNNM